jgi:hypothetical protein
MWPNLQAWRLPPFRPNAGLAGGPAQGLPEMPRQTLQSPLGPFGRSRSPLGIRYGRLSQTAWAQKSPKGTTPTCSGIIGHMGPPSSIGAEGPPWVRSRGPALPCPVGRPGDPRVRRAARGWSCSREQEPDRPGVGHVANAGALPNSSSGLEPHGRLGRQCVPRAPEGTVSATGRSAPQMPFPRIPHGDIILRCSVCELIRDQATGG